MATTVLLSDYVTNKHYHLVFTTAEFKCIEDNWHKKDKLLVELSDTTVFRNRTRWCDLEPFHYQVLIIKNITKLDNLTDAEQMDESNEVVKSLHFLISGMIKVLEKYTQTSVELLRIDRISDSNVNFIHQGSISIQLDDKKTEKKKMDSLKIIVDNTKKVD